MKMEAAGKAEELLDSEVPPKASEKQKTASEKQETASVKQETAPDEDGPIELETHTQKDSEPTASDSAVLSSMPCLLMELRRDSSESQLASPESDKPVDGQVYESDSSNHCTLSPSSSGHLADSEDPSGVSGSAAGRKSRRSRSESEISTMAAKKNRQSVDKQNSRVTKVKGYRSQKHKERIRLLRQKREAAARKKYNLLQDSSTSDSDLTCDSSASSSDEDEAVSGSSKTITAEIPDGPPVVAHYDISDTNSDPEVVNVDNLLATEVVQEHNNSLGNQDLESSWGNRGLLDELGADGGCLDTGFLASGPSPSNTQINEEINISSSDSEVEIVGVQEHGSYPSMTDAPKVENITLVFCFFFVLFFCSPCHGDIESMLRLEKNHNVKRMTSELFL
uniref:Arkadia (RNF111) N-terminal like PKA signaling regulator 2N n=1 Tax=Meleagris gallopavo TaxID=9103 RepID=A0A803Y2G0_MELGA